MDSAHVSFLSIQDLTLVSINMVAESLSNICYWEGTVNCRDTVSTQGSAMMAKYKLRPPFAVAMHPLLLCAMKYLSISQKWPAFFYIHENVLSDFI